MNTLSLAYVAFGGAVGAMARYALATLVIRLTSSDFPFGTLAVNVLGSFVLGLWISSMAYAMPGKARDLHLLIAVGFLGGFTTFSAFSLDIFLLMERGLAVQTVLYAVGSVVLSVLALFAGMALVRSFT